MNQPAIADQGKPIPFKELSDEEKARILASVETGGSPPTTFKQCVALGGHGGPNGDRWYYTNTGNKKPHPWLDNVKVCEICGTVDI